MNSGELSKIFRSDAQKAPQQHSEEPPNGLCHELVWRSARKGPVWGAHAPSRAGDDVLFIAYFSSPSDATPVALKVRCGEGAPTRTCVRSPERPDALRYIQVIQPPSNAVYPIPSRPGTLSTAAVGPRPKRNRTGVDSAGCHLRSCQTNLRSG